MRRSFYRGLVTLALGVAMTLPAAAATQLTGAGSTFDYPFFSKAFYIYNQKRPDVTVNYQSIGSGGGIQQFTAKTVDFGASDVPMNAEELRRAKQAVLQIPATLGGESIAYNLPGVSATLRLSRQVLADIYLGKIAQVERSGDRQAQRGRQASRHADRGRPSFRRIGDDATSSPTS